MKRNKLIEVFGFTRVINHTTGEIHKVNPFKDSSKLCNLTKLKHSGYATPLWAWLKIKLGLSTKAQFKNFKSKYNGCAICNLKYDKP